MTPRQEISSLRESEAHFRNLFEQSPIAYQSLDENACFLDINARHCQLLGYAAETLIGRHFAEFAEPTPGVSFQETFDRFKAEGRIQMEMELKRKDGARISVLLSGSVQRDAAGNFVRTHCVLHDITERKHMEQALRASEERYRLLVEQTPDGIFVGDTQGHYVDVNAAGAQMLGYTRDELLTMSIRDVIHADEIARIPAELARYEGGTVATAIWRFRRKDGSEFIGEVVGRCLPDGRLQGIVRDITLREQAEAVLAEREILLRTITDISPDPIFMLDRSLRMVYANPATLAVIRTGSGQPDLSLDQIIGKTALDHFGDPAVARALMEADEQVMASGQAGIREVEMGAPGHQMTQQISRTPYRDGSGQVIGMIGVSRDITRHKQGEAARLAELERQRDSLVREVHHRIKNHLQGITGLLSNRISDHPESTGQLEDVIRQINTIANVYGLQSRRGEPRIELCHLLRETADVATAIAPVECLLPPSGGDRGLLHTEAVPMALVINELITNAAKHVTGALPGRPVRMALEDDGAAVRIRIRGGPSTLPAGFDYAAGHGLGTGLDLVRHLLPPIGAYLRFSQDGDEVVAELALAPSLFNRDPQ